MKRVWLAIKLVATSCMLLVVLLSLSLGLEQGKVSERMPVIIFLSILALLPWIVEAIATRPTANKWLKALGYVAERVILLVLTLVTYAAFGSLGVSFDDFMGYFCLGLGGWMVCYGGYLGYLLLSKRHRQRLALDSEPAHRAILYRSTGDDVLNAGSRQRVSGGYFDRRLMFYALTALSALCLIGAGLMVYAPGYG